MRTRITCSTPCWCVETKRWYQRKWRTIAICTSFDEAVKRANAHRDKK